MLDSKKECYCKCRNCGRIFTGSNLKVLISSIEKLGGRIEEWDYRYLKNVYCPGCNSKMNDIRNFE